MEVAYIYKEDWEKKEEERLVWLLVAFFDVFVLYLTLTSEWVNPLTQYT